jgi:hypothetical protein
MGCAILSMLWVLWLPSTFTPVRTCLDTGRIRASARHGPFFQHADTVFSTWKQNSPISRLRRGDHA